MDNTPPTYTPPRNTMSIADELRVIRNYLHMMSKAYRERNTNWVIVRDIIMWGTCTAGCTSCMEECVRLGVDPYGFGMEDVDLGHADGS